MGPYIPHLKIMNKTILEVKWIDIKDANKLMPYIPNHIAIEDNKRSNFAHYYFHGKV